jgi:hypothetical protein
MKIPVSSLKWAAIFLLSAWVIWLFLLWQPARQIELHTANLLSRASGRDWTAVTGMILPDYRDAWGHGREESIGKAEQLFNHFFTLKILPTGPMDIRVAGGAGTNSVPLGVFGSGTPIAHAVMDEVREAGGYFVFRWRQTGNWPWQWSLVEAGHAELAARYPR